MPANNPLIVGRPQQPPAFKRGLKRPANLPISIYHYRTEKCQKFFPIIGSDLTLAYRTHFILLIPDQAGTGLDLTGDTARIAADSRTSTTVQASAAAGTGHEVPALMEKPITFGAA